MLTTTHFSVLLRDGYGGMVDEAAGAVTGDALNGGGKVLGRYIQPLGIVAHVALCAADAGGYPLESGAVLQRPTWRKSACLTKRERLRAPLNKKQYYEKRRVHDRTRAGHRQQIKKSLIFEALLWCKGRRVVIPCVSVRWSVLRPAS